MTIIRIILCLSVCISFLTAVAYPQNDSPPVHPNTISNATCEISVVDLPELDDEGNKTVTITTKDIQSGKSHTWEYRSSRRGLERLHMTPNGKLLVIGEEPWSHGRWIDILDLQKRNVEKSFLCYDYWLSPSGRAMAYTTWHPRFDLYRQYLLAIHDFNEGSLGTPLAMEDKPNPEHASGWILFPEENVRQKSGDVTLTKGFSIRSPVLWEQKETLVFFFIYDESDYKNYLVMVDIKAGLYNPAIFRKFIDVNRLLYWDRMPKEDRERFEKKTFPFYADSLELTENFTIIAKSNYNYHDKQLEFTLDDLECTLEGTKP